MLDTLGSYILIPRLTCSLPISPELKPKVMPSAIVGHPPREGVRERRAGLGRIRSVMRPAPRALPGQCPEDRSRLVPRGPEDFSTRCPWFNARHDEFIGPLIGVAAGMPAKQLATNTTLNPAERLIISSESGRLLTEILAALREVVPAYAEVASHGRDPITQNGDGKRRRPSQNVVESSRPALNEANFEIDRGTGYVASHPCHTPASNQNCTLPNVLADPQTPAKPASRLDHIHSPFLLGTGATNYELSLPCYCH
jgi:hypothetical protein